MKTCHEPSDKFKSVFTVENTTAPTPARRNGEEGLESVAVVGKDTNRLPKGLDPYEANGPEEVSS